VSFQQPASFRPLLRDDNLPHQIRFLSHGAGAPIYGCVCKVVGGVGFSIEALVWYRQHLGEVATSADMTLSDGVSSGSVARGTMEV
jgi:hypothetical protein